MRARNYSSSEIDDALNKLIEQLGAENILRSMETTMSTDDMADALTDVCDEYDMDLEDLI